MADLTPLATAEDIHNGKEANTMIVHLFVFCVIIGIPGLIALFIYRVHNIDPIRLQQLRLEEMNEEVEFGKLHTNGSPTFNTSESPAFNIDGSLMVGSVDINGKPFGSF